MEEINTNNNINLNENDNNKIKVINKVEGYVFKFNNIIYKLNEKYDYDHTIIFGGDIQDSKDRMEDDDQKWVHFSHENTVHFISEKFPKSHIWLIQPARKVGSHSEFDYLTTPGIGSVHLYHLIENVCKLVSHNSEKKLNPHLPINLVAFSKGCVVINHLLAELASVNRFNIEKQIKIIDWDDREFALRKLTSHYESNLKLERCANVAIKMMKFGLEKGPAYYTKELFKKVKALYFLDGHRFITEKECIKYCFDKNFSPSIYVFATPRQMNDKVRSYISEAYEIFKKLLKEFHPNIKLEYKIYFNNEPSSLLNHFKILTEFENDPNY